MEDILDTLKGQTAPRLLAGLAVLVVCLIASRYAARLVERALRRACLLTVYIKRSTNLMLLAEEQGIGTCWIGFAEALFDDPEFKQGHKVPANFKLVATLSMGFRKHETKPCERRAPVFFCR